MPEQWRPIVDFPDYEVSDLGKIRRITFGRGTNAPHGILKFGVSPKGYLRVYFSKDCKKYTKSVHRIVAEAFIPNPLHLPQVNHIDTNKSNCAVSNLEWRSGLGNMQHAATKERFGKGVYYYPKIGKYRATYNPTSRNRVVIGDFLTEEEALIARKAAIDSLNMVI
jgi:hypothetical protein